VKQYAAKDIRNIVLAGHANSGKTSLVEALLYCTGNTDRLGKISDGNTVCDHDPEEIRRKTTVALTVAPAEWKNHKYNFIDTPGLFDFAQGINEGMRAAETALITVSGKSGVSVGTERAFTMAGNRNMARVFFVNKLDSDHADFYKVLTQLKTKFGPAVCPLVVPYVKDHKVQCYIDLLEYRAFSYVNGKPTLVTMPDMGERLEGLRTAIHEAVAETSEEAFEKYFSGEDFTPEELMVGLSAGVHNGTIYPVFCGATATTDGIDLLLKGLEWLIPSAEQKGAETDVDGNELTVDENAPAAAIVFRTVSDPFVGKLSYFKVVSGCIRSDMTLMNSNTGGQGKIGKLLITRGKKQEDADCIPAGDIGAVAKLGHTSTGDTLCAPERKVVLEGVPAAKAPLCMAILPKKKGDEEKIASGLNRLMEEDTVLRYETNHETHQMLLYGMGAQHLDVTACRLKSRFGVDVVLQLPKVAYRETIRKKVAVQGRHKKQTGGHGQFGDVWIEFEPCECDGLEFAERVVGGSVPKNFFPAIEKGLRECIQQGPLAGYPVVGLRATLYDGSYHPVDSSEMAFKMAASLAYKSGMPQAKPVLLEPFGTLRVSIPDENMGDIMGEVNKRRGRVLGMHPDKPGYQMVEAEAPVAEMYDFLTFLRQTAQGRGMYSFEFVRYEEAPPQVVAKIVAEANK
jgi:elongation factor G